MAGGASTDAVGVPDDPAARAHAADAAIPAAIRAIAATVRCTAAARLRAAGLLDTTAACNRPTFPQISGPSASSSSRLTKVSGILQRSGS